jgi:hypothetical protein
MLINYNILQITFGSRNKFSSCFLAVRTQTRDARKSVAYVVTMRFTLSYIITFIYAGCVF